MGAADAGGSAELGVRGRRRSAGSSRICSPSCRGFARRTTRRCGSIAGRTASATRPIRCPIWRPTAPGWKRRCGSGRPSGPQRRRLFARRGRRELTLSDRAGLDLRLPLERGGTTRPSTPLADWQRQGVKIRSRALITTLWARLALGDLFLHGIGGAKYDQVTDLLIGDFFGLAPPRHHGLSATLHLPVARRRVTADDQRGSAFAAVARAEFHPEKLSWNRSGPRHATLLAAKRRWIATPADSRQCLRAVALPAADQRALQPLLAAQSPSE